MKIKSIALLVVTVCSLHVQAQRIPNPVNERSVWFPYAVGQRTDGKLKVMIIGTHLLRFKDFDHSPAGVDVAMSLDFTDILDQMEREEHVTLPDYDNISFSKSENPYLYGSYSNWHYATVGESDLATTDNTLTAMEKVRETLIEKYRSDGYKIYQYNFTPLVDGPHSAGGYVYYDKASMKYIPFEFEKLSPLSPLYIAVYHMGEIRQMLESIGSSVGQNPGLVIESSGDKDDPSKSNSSGTSTSKEKTDEEIERDLNYNKVRADILEGQGDELYKLGTMFYMQALSKYQEAQSIYYTPQRQQKIDEINAYATIGKALNNAAEKLDEAEFKADPKGFYRRWKFLGFTYETSTDRSFSQPSLDLQPSFLFLAFGLKFGYVINAMQSYHIHMDGMEYTASPRPSYTPVSKFIPETVTMETRDINMEVSFGLNIPIKKYFNLRPMYGFSAINGAKELTLKNDNGFAPKKSNALDDLKTKSLNRFSLGWYYHVPKTGMGFGITLNYLMQKAFYSQYDIALREIELKYVGKDPKYSYPDSRFRLDKPLDENFKKFTVGCSLIFGLAKK